MAMWLVAALIPIILILMGIQEQTDEHGRMVMFSEIGMTTLALSFIGFLVLATSQAY